jgi:hypothetical protein
MHQPVQIGNMLYFQVTMDTFRIRVCIIYLSILPEFSFSNIRFIPFSAFYFISLVILYICVVYMCVIFTLNNK